MTPALAQLRAEADALARDAAAMDAILERPGALLAAARAAGMPVIDYTIAHVMPVRARALVAKHRAECMRKGVPFEAPVFVCERVNAQLEALIDERA
jgi:nicotinamidase-related amidase